MNGSSHEIFKKSQSEIKHCYYSGCEQAPIQSHSIAERKVLGAISESGIVLMPDNKNPLSNRLVKVGIKQASTVKCFCKEHDQKLFAPIDNEDYVIGDKRQEFLFALRAAARELLVKEAAVQTCNHWTELEHYGSNKAVVTILSEINKGQILSVKDQNKTQTIFMNTYQKQKFNAIRTVCIVLDGWHPIAASSSFYIETDLEGNIVNDVLASGYNTKIAPCFLTLFPQGEKTYCLISYFNRDRKTYIFLNDINNRNNHEKGVVVSNLLAGYVENLVIRPSFWRTFDNKSKFYSMRTFLMRPHQYLVEDDSFNMFA